jgi:phospholipid-binding lipoprotein MlaA
MRIAIQNSAYSAVIAAFLALFVFVAPAAAQPDNPNDDYYSYDDYYGGSVYDPIEPFNRAVFKFNQVLDTFLLRPVAKGYVTVVPEFGRDRVHNVLTNLNEPVDMLNGFFQGKPERGFTSLWRFIINSTLGVAGLFDFAGHNFGLARIDEDFGQTMGHYGAGSGFYLVLPVIGPSSARDTVGLVADILSNPLNYIDDDRYIYGRIGLTIVDSRSQNLDLLDEIYRTSVDPYATIRSGYLQRRAALVRDNEPRGASVGY